jgi:hypothetical protein
MDKVDDLKHKMAQAQVLATLEDHPGWQKIVTLLENQIASFSASICQLGMDHETTERMRGDIAVMRWCRRSTQLASPQQYAQWEQDLAKAEQKAKMIEDRGLPPGGR